jgi:endonuclease YncB( thermonuclease family)
MISTKLRTPGNQDGLNRRPCEYPSVVVPLLIAAALGALYFGVSGAQYITRSTISGSVRIIDGDTVIVAGTVVRLKGVDAAELGTPRGENAKRMMLALVTSELTCHLTGEKTHGREVGYCFTSDGIDINQAIIASSAALACPRYSDRYLQFERAEALAAQVRAPYCERTPR